jgi:hypothetical protein
MPLDQIHSDYQNTTESLLYQTLEMISLERGGRLDRSADVARRLAESCSDFRDLHWRLYSDIPSGSTSALVTDLFSLLIYNTLASGRSVCEWAQQVLENESDLRPIQIALHACDWEVYPFHKEDEMKSTVAGITARYSEVTEQCCDFVEGRYRSMRDERYPRIREEKQGFQDAGDA